MKQKINSTKAPAAIGPYSQAVKYSNLLFCSGNIGIDPKTNSFVQGDIKEQTKQTFKNLGEVLKAAGTVFDNVLKVTVYLKNMNDFAAMNKVYATYFKEPYPARATVEVARLPKDALIEVECIAYVRDNKSGCYGKECNCEC